MTVHVDLLICKTKITILINYYTDKLQFYRYRNNSKGEDNYSS